jgi:hypothetical protein
LDRVRIGLSVWEGRRGLATARPGKVRGIKDAEDSIYLEETGLLINHLL